MTTAPRPTSQGFPLAAPTPLATIHATGMQARQLSPTVAEIRLVNAGFIAQCLVTREELAALATQLGALADQLQDAGPQLVTPAGAGQLVLPGQSS